MKKICMILCLPLLLSSCAKQLTPFSEKLKEQNNWSEAELKQIQFYLSEDIVIFRQASESSSEIVAGEIKVVNGKEVEEVFIPRGTPGILTFVDGKENFAMSFEAGTGAEDRFLTFGPNPNYNDKYGLLASGWNKRVGTITYDGKKYSTNPSSTQSFLLVDMKRINKTKVDKRTAKGVKL